LSPTSRVTVGLQSGSNWSCRKQGCVPAHLLTQAAPVVAALQQRKRQSQVAACPLEPISRLLPAVVSSEQRRRLGLIAALGTSQTLAWASSYYLVAIVADPIARDLSTSTTEVFAAFSVALAIPALLGPRVGRTIDLFGGREVLGLSNLLFAAGLLTLSFAPTTLVMWLGWFIIGVAMGLGLYDAAFATLGRIYGQTARSAITGITLIAGFASTVGWPLTNWGAAVVDGATPVQLGRWRIFA